MKFREVKIGDYVRSPRTDILVQVTEVKKQGQFIVLRLGLKDDVVVGYPNENVNYVTAED